MTTTATRSGSEPAVDPSRPPRPSRLPSLTGARGPGALLVVVGHLADQVHLQPWHAAVPILLPATSMVSMFFMLSGFVLAWSSRPGQPVRAFWRRRAARILPLYWTTLALAYAVDLAIHARLPRSALSTVLLLQSWIPTVRGPYAVNVPAWSLSVEVSFYLAFPWLLWLATRIPARRRLAVVVALAAVALGIAVVSQQLPFAPGEVLSTTFPPTRLAEFFAGAVLALHVRDGWRPRIRPTHSFLLALAAYAALAFTPQVYRNAAVSFLPMCLLVGVLAARDADGHRSWLARPRVVRFGDWSYALYLVHLPILLAVFHALPRSLTSTLAGGLLTGLAVIASSVVAAKLLHERVEVPAERWINARGSRRLASPPARSSSTPVLPRQSSSPSDRSLVSPEPRPSGSGRQV